MDRKIFYDALRPTLGALTQANVAGFELFLDEGQRRRTPLNDMAYVLATVWWETGKTMQPVKEAYWVKNAEEWRKKHLRYYPFYGRSYPQFTWEQNYRRATDTWNSKYRKPGDPAVDFVKHPDDIMDPRYGVPLTFDAMENGWFTGKKLADFIDDIDESDEEDLREFKNARKVVNGTDKQTEIGRLALAFEQALRAAGWAPGLQPDEEPAPSVRPEAPSAGGLLGTIIRIFVSVLAALKRKQ